MAFYIENTANDSEWTGLFVMQSSGPQALASEAGSTNWSLVEYFWIRPTYQGAIANISQLNLILYYNNNGGILGY